MRSVNEIVFGEEKKMTIGVLDDNPAICQLLETFLIFAGHAVYVTSSPSDLAANISTIECIVVDFHLPGRRSGADVIRQVRRDYPHLPAVLVSASPIPSTALQELSDVEVLQKPFSSSLLLKAIALAQKRATEPLL
jgi:CheY-like chemotaxis protein